jgi:multidrug resistance protein, MATE family
MSPENTVTGEIALPSTEISTDQQANHPVDERRMRRRVLKLAAPVIGENLLQTMLGIVDTILVAGLGIVALAGVGASLQVIFVLLAALSALSVGASVLVAHAVGAGNLAEAGRMARQAIVWSVLIAIPITLIGLPLTPALIGLFGLDAATAGVAADYLSVNLGAVAPLALMLLVSGVLRGAGDARTPMLVTLLANVINVALSYGLIYGVLGFPELGAVGSAWGTFFSRLVGAIILVAILLRGHNGVRAWGGSWRPEVPAVRDVLRIGLPAALEEVLVISAFAVLTPIVAVLGTAALAAHRVAINIISLSFLPGIGFGLAATALVGNALGAGRADEARAITRIAARWALIWMGGLGLVFLIFAEPLMRIFGDDPELIRSGAEAVRIVALVQILWALTFVYGGALRGTGDTRTPLIITSAMMWLAVLLGFLGMRFITPALYVVWGAFLITGPIEAWLFHRAWRRALPEEAAHHRQQALSVSADSADERNANSARAVDALAADDTREEAVQAPGDTRQGPVQAPGGTPQEDV